MPLKLICEFASPNEQVFTQPVIKIGKLSSSHFLLDHPDVSRMHAVIEENAGEYQIVDLGSHSGTKVDGCKVIKAPLIEGSMIEFGKVVVRAYVEDVRAPGPEWSAVVDRLNLKHLQGVISKAREKIEDAELTGESGGGLVRVTMSGAFEPRKVRIEPEVAGDVEMLQDLVLAALVDVHAKFVTGAIEEMQAQMGKSALSDLISRVVGGK